MPITPSKLLQLKQQGQPIVILTAADFPTAQVLDQAGVDGILVGDSLAMVHLGHPNTLPLTLEEMFHHTRAVRRGVKNALLICDLPFMSYQESTTQAIHNAGRALKETGADAVKLEGANPEILEIVDRLTHIGIPVMGHVGLTPQSVKQLGFKQQGKSALEGDRILSEALGLQAAGAFSIVLEHIPTDLATQISKTLTIPTIGIGAGPDCDGQVLVTADLLGLSEWQPPFAKVYTNLRQTMQEAVGRYAQEVRTGEYRNNPSQQ